MPMGPADLTLAKLNSVLGGKGGEWGSEEGPSGAALPVAIRGEARRLGNAGQPAAAAELLLNHAAKVRAPISPALLAEVEQNIVPIAANPTALQATVASLRAIPATTGKDAGKGGNMFSKLFGRR